MIKSIVINKQNPNTALEAFQHAVRVRSLALHEIAFNFPSGEDLKVEKSSEFVKYRKDTRVAQITQGDSSIKIESGSEATTKAQVVAKRKRW